jgi:hypothetical protein
MSEDSVVGNGNGEATIDPAGAAVPQPVIDALLQRLNAAVTNAEEANRKANSEALYAFNAKTTCEAHATEISKIKGAVEAESTWLATTRKSVEDAAQTTATAVAEAVTNARVITASKADVDAAVLAIESASAQSQNGLTAIEAAQTEAKNVKQRIADAAAEVVQTKATVDTQSSAVQALHTQVSTAAADVQVHSATVMDCKNRSVTLLGLMEDVKQTATSAQARAAEYEEQLKQLGADCADLHKKIEALLPGATSAGLASAFENEKRRFVLPQLVSVGIFVIAAIALAVIGSQHLKDVATQAAGTAITWDLVLRNIANRLLLVGPLLWVGYVALRNFTTALRLQEDYAYKEVISRSFEGYKREMANLPPNVDVAPLVRLCENVLTTIGQRPGRLYEGKHDDITPLTPLTSLTKDVLKAVNDLAAKIPGLQRLGE